MPASLILNENTLNEYENIIFHEILTFNHDLYPKTDKFYFKVSDLIEESNLSNKSHILNRISKNIINEKTALNFEEKGNKVRVPIFKKISLLSKENWENLGYSEATVEITLHEDVKAMLTEYSNAIVEGRTPQFFRGDKGKLRELRGQTKTTMYWFIRKYQSTSRTKEIEIDLQKFKSEINLESKYPEFKDLRKFVLDVAHKSFKNEWVEFSYEQIFKGRKVVALKFIFKKGYEDERNVPYGDKYKYEAILKYDLSFDDAAIQKLRNCIERQEKFKYLEEVRIGGKETEMEFTEEYVAFIINYSIKIIKKKIQQKEKVPNPNGFIMSAVLEGWFTNYFKKYLDEKEKIRIGILDSKGQYKLI
jgi:hypothetical protein